jgi:hypothetical protein
MLAPFDGFHESEHAVTGTCLISFDRNRYSVMAKAARRTVQVRAYADRIVVRCGDEVVAEHARHFGRDRTIYDPWHYLPVLARKPGALRNGAPFQGWESAASADAAAAQAGHRRRGRPPVRAGAGGRADRWPGAVEAAIREALANGHRQRRGDPQHPGPAPRAATAAEHRHVVEDLAAASADRRLRPLRYAARLRCSGMR